MKRIPCASHMLNNVLKDMIKKVPEISSVWEQVSISLICHVG